MVSYIFIDVEKLRLLKEEAAMSCSDYINTADYKYDLYLHEKVYERFSDEEIELYGFERLQEKVHDEIMDSHDGPDRE